MIMVGYAKNSTADTYRMYNPKTKKVCQTCDVVWMGWKKQDPQRDGSIFNQIPEMTEDKPGVDEVEVTVLNKNIANVIPDDDDKSISEAGRKDDSKILFAKCDWAGSIPTKRRTALPTNQS